MNQKSATPILVFSALLLVQVLFGVNYVISKIVVDVFPPLVWASIRVVIAALVMTGAAVLFRRSHPKDGKKFFVPLIAYSLLGIIINQASFLVGLKYTTATNSAVLNTLIPVFTLMIVTLRGQERLTWKRILGFVCAFGGVLVIRRVEDLTLSNQTVLGDLLTILNCLSYAFFLSYSKRFLEQHDRIWTTAWLFIYGSFAIGVISIPSWQGFQWPVMDARLIGCMIFAVIGGTILTYFLNLWALAQVKSSSVALFIYVQPIVASLLAWAWLGQQITARTVVSTLLIFAGLLLALAPREPREKTLGA